MCRKHHNRQAWWHRRDRENSLDGVLPHAKRVVHRARFTLVRVNKSDPPTVVCGHLQRTVVIHSGWRSHRLRKVRCRRRTAWATAAEWNNMEDSPDDQDDQDSAVETESNCSYEETAAKIEMVLRRNLRLDTVDGNDNKHLTHPTIGTSSSSSSRCYCLMSDWSFYDNNNNKNNSKKRSKCTAQCTVPTLKTISNVTWCLISRHFTDTEICWSRVLDLDLDLKNVCRL